MTEVETAWLAGLLEGEGTFFLNRNIVGGKLYLYPLVAVAMIDRDVIWRAAELFGTKCLDGAKCKSGKPYFRAVATGKRAIGIMRAIRPLMGERRGTKIDSLLVDWEARPAPNVLRSTTLKSTLKEKQIFSRPV